ncbi:MAG TPA: JAB domain-containing protein [Thermomicrobiales bacterium]|nr:JAB domain-containing protein [Thermomicrobiales bacterium]
MAGSDDDRQVSLLAPDAATLIHLLRENVRLLRALVERHEVGRLAPPGDAPTVRTPEDLAAYLGPEMADLAQEQVRVALLDSRNRLLGVHLVCQGGLNAAVVRLADCFREAIRVNAAALVLIHNHPSGDPTPSPDDCRLTAAAGRLGDDLGIDLLDHLVIGGDRHVSLRRAGLYVPPGQAPAAGPAVPAAPDTGP